MLIKNLNRQEAEFTATPDKYPQKMFYDKPCRWCSTEFKPVAPSHLYCSDPCRNKAREDNYFKKMYGVTRADVYQQLEDQNHLCRICNDVGFRLHHAAVNTLVLDHDHATGAPRGLLCHNCNRGLGLFQDDREILRSAIRYLEGATTMAMTSTPKQVEARDISNDDDIVCST